MAMNSEPGERCRVSVETTETARASAAGVFSARPPTAWRISVSVSGFMRAVYDLSGCLARYPDRDKCFDPFLSRNDFADDGIATAYRVIIRETASGHESDSAYFHGNCAGVPYAAVTAPSTRVHSSTSSK